MASLFSQFDFNPTSTTLKTSGYTVPVGKYAFVTAIVPQFTINGVQMFPIQTVSIGNSGASTGAITFPILSPLFLTGQTTRNSDGGGITLVGTISGGNASQSIGKLPGTGTSIFTPFSTMGTTFTVSSTGGGVVSNSLVTTCNLHWFGGSANTFWVPTGTVLTGAQYSVIEYDIIRT